MGREDARGRKMKVCDQGVVVQQKPSHAFALFCALLLYLFQFSLSGVLHTLHTVSLMSSLWPMPLFYH